MIFNIVDFLAFPSSIPVSFLQVVPNAFGLYHANSINNVTSYTT